MVCRELLRATRALTSEFQLPSTSWPNVLNIVQSSLNNSPSRRLSGKCPLEVVTGLPQSTALLSVRGLKKTAEVHSLPDIRARQLLQIDTIHSAIQDIHKEVVDSSSKQRQVSVKSHNMKAGVNTINLAPVITNYEAFFN